jgi:hypothetical protein
VLGARLGARTGAPETLESIARELRISRERVRQLELRALQRIQRADVALEIELREPEILVRLRVRDARPGRRRPWRVRRELLRDLGLDERETEILARRLALRGGEAETVRTVARDAGLGAERVRQIERIAIDALTRRGTVEIIEKRDPELLALLRQRAQAGARRRRRHRGSETVRHARAR